MNAVLNSSTTAGASYSNVINHDFLVTNAMSQLERDNCIKVSFDIGSSNTHEDAPNESGMSSTTEHFLAGIVRAQGVDNSTAQDIALLCPDIPAIGLLATSHKRPIGTCVLRSTLLAAVSSDLD